MKRLSVDELDELFDNGEDILDYCISDEWQSAYILPDRIIHTVVYDGDRIVDDFYQRAGDMLSPDIA